MASSNAATGLATSPGDACSFPRLFSATLLAAFALLTSCVSCDDGWKTGRATFYGDDGGATLNQGSCMYGDLSKGPVSTGTYIAALSDKNDDFAGSCGRCYEVSCDPRTLYDGYGQQLDRQGACYEGKTVTVTITDSCPCDYPANAYSNRRWCCGDTYHMDLSTQAFEQIANIGEGVIGIKYRPVDCPGGYRPAPRPATWDFPAGNTGR